VLQETYIIAVVTFIQIVLNTRVFVAMFELFLYILIKLLFMF